MNNWLLTVVAFLVFTAFWGIYHIIMATNQKASFSKKEIKGKVIERNKENGIVIVRAEYNGKVIYINNGFYYNNCGKKLTHSLIKDIAESNDKEVHVYLNKHDLRHSSITCPSMIIPLRYYITVFLCSLLIIATMVYV
ncbi:hypothetical protein LMH73_007520 [Vibrio splendidus]|nr:hypothetical protein [Vibrio splendidus]MCC4880378.1 hypothetical protein [Vibrio splendidus]